MIKAPYLITPGVAAHIAPELQRILWHYAESLPAPRSGTLEAALSGSARGKMSIQRITFRQDPDGLREERSVWFPDPVEQVLRIVFEESRPVICLAAEYTEGARQ